MRTVISAKTPAKVAIATYVHAGTSKKRSKSNSQCDILFEINQVHGSYIYQRLLSVKIRSLVERLREQSRHYKYMRWNTLPSLQYKPPSELRLCWCTYKHERKTVPGKKSVVASPCRKGKQRFITSRRRKRNVLVLSVSCSAPSASYHISSSLVDSSSLIAWNFPFSEPGGARMFSARSPVYLKYPP